MHADEIDADVSLVSRLLAAQFPRWAALPLKRVASAGTDNAIYRLGSDMCVRLPRRPSAAGQVEKEGRWLPMLTPLPLTIPRPLGLGKPDAGYPWHWSVTSWIDGETATMDRIADPMQAAATLAQFIKALQAIDPTDGPPSGPQNHFRGVPLVEMDATTREAIGNLRAEIDTGAANAVWEAALGAPAWADPPVWVHGDIQSGNLLARQGRITAVIDFGLLSVGDPACDLTVAWMLLSDDTRAAFRTAMSVDDAMWARGRGWALYAGVIALDYYRETNHALAATCRRAIGEVIAEFTC